MSASRPARSLRPAKARYALCRRLGGPQGWSGQVRKISPPPGLDPRTVQPVASRYTDYATRLTRVAEGTTNFLVALRLTIGAVHVSAFLRNLCCCDCQNRQYAVSGCFDHRYVIAGVVGGEDCQFLAIFALSSVSVEHNVSIFRRKTEAEFPPKMLVATYQTT